MLYCTKFASETKFECLTLVVRHAMKKKTSLPYFKDFILTFREFKEDVQMKSDNTCGIIILKTFTTGSLNPF